MFVEGKTKKIVGHATEIRIIICMFDMDHRHHATENGIIIRMFDRNYTHLGLNYEDRDRIYNLIIVKGNSFTIIKLHFHYSNQPGRMKLSFTPWTFLRQDSLHLFAFFFAIV